MRVLILGGNGMLGHKVTQRLSRRFAEVAATVRRPASAFENEPTLQGARIFGDVSANDHDSVERVFSEFNPDAVVNCIGLIKHLVEDRRPVEAIEANSLFPHRVAELCRETGARFIHFSTDCVFSGRKGPYSEEDLPDPTDLYGRSKLLGEVAGAGCLTIRSSFVGRELGRSIGLAEWLISQRGGEIKGYVNAYFTGLATPAMADVVGDLIESHPNLSGIWNIASEPISKFDLLTLINEKLNLNVRIKPDESFFCDRRLDGSCFAVETGFKPPSWSHMIDGMANDPTGYPSSISDHTVARA